MLIESFIGESVVLAITNTTNESCAERGCLLTEFTDDASISLLLLANGNIDQIRMNSIYSSDTR